MAIYYNMCVDCGADTALADLLESHFRDYLLQFDDRDSVRCKTLRIMQRGIEFAGVEPIGMGSCLLYTSPSPRDRTRSRMPSSA